MDHSLVNAFKTFGFFADKLDFVDLNVSSLQLTNGLTARITSLIGAVTKEPARSTSSVRAQLIGSWRLMSRQSRRSNGQVETDAGLSAMPLGILTYDHSGHAAAPLSRRHP